MLRLWTTCILASLLLTTASCAQDDASRANRLLQSAAADFTANRYEAAVQKAKEAAALLKDSAEVQQQAARILYICDQPSDSLPFFDRANELMPAIAPHNWERGIALGTVGKWVEGAEQFKSHHDVNPNDVENSAWYFLCVAKSVGLEDAKKTVIPSQGDGREPMMTILQMLKGEKTPEEVIVAAEKNTTEGPRRRTALFYADLYVGLYYDSIGNDEKAVKHLKESLRHGVPGYMADTARVYLNHRFPNQTIQNNQNAK